MKKITKLHAIVGDFAENKDIAKKLRVEMILPSLASGHTIVLDFSGVSGATQSFIHALLSDPIREYKDIAYEKLEYKNANPDIKEIISIVYRYMQESMDG